ncbi:hypothetical protein [Amycolatopsis keratiniphila]|uniref:hypothetical protein n=1 Tax=Amycolatopsis keratiniphila TaxID=129921 RepID=UPI00087BC291|nr:hypothetical protein [Amycolatopsis keratiniphila]OLZ56270.1 hypothetical protein BS330_19390 [Amycolatopsis keratiniphila subsp. nogabecina]SDU52925.1 hypothetical protein SAMN04489733_5542 [Amycolatopsis keratiniphila]
MDLTAGGARAVPVARSERTGLVPAGTVLAGSVISLVGLTWDIQWHGDVGPDTFFTMPHLFLYSGSAISGLASLVVVLMTTAARRAGRPVDARVGGRAINVFGKVFAAPAGYLVTGTGAAMFLLYGLWDQWWHGLYGFDAVIDSPPHIGLLLSITLSIIGTVMVFAAAREHRWGTVGVVGNLGVLIAFSTVTVLGLQQIDVDGLDVVSVGIALLSVLLVSAGAGFWGRPGGAVRVAAALAVIQAITWWFSPWAAEAYASAVGLPMRDYIDGVPAMPSMMPMALLPIAAVLEAVYLLSRRWPAGRVSVLAGLIGGLLVGASMPIQNAIVYDSDRMPWAVVFATGAAGAVVGLLGGFAGWRFGGMLRLLAPAKGENAHA